jgi:hypothetical protein
MLGALHCPHAMLPPQPSAAIPHSAPTALQDLGWHSQRYSAPSVTHSEPSPHDPQLSTAPQPSGIMPQLALSCSHVIGVHAVSPHLFWPAPPQNFPAAQLPHSMMAPQSSGICQHSAPTRAHVLFTQPSPPASSGAEEKSDPLQPCAKTQTPTPTAKKAPRRGIMTVILRPYVASVEPAGEA